MKCDNCGKPAGIVLANGKHSCGTSRRCDLLLTFGHMLEGDDYRQVCVMLAHLADLTQEEQDEWWENSKHLSTPIYEFVGDILQKLHNSGIGGMDTYVTIPPPSDTSPSA